MDNDDWMKKVVERNGQALQESAVYLSMFTKNFMKDPKCMLELGMAIMMDKPICLLVFDGVKLPDNLKRVATKIEYVNKNDMDGVKDATQKIMTEMALQ
jgi:hypothetical protein